MKTAKCIDIDGNMYKTVKIGHHLWMAENLKVTHYCNGDPIPQVTIGSYWVQLTTGAYCNYDNKLSNADSYGCLYNWYAANNKHNIAPIGWHVPSDEEWKQLEIHLGMSRLDAESIGGGRTNPRGNKEGGKMKEKGTKHWKSPNNKASNKCGFTALPGGCRFGERFAFMGHVATFWSSTEDDKEFGWNRTLDFSHPYIVRTAQVKHYGLSVRCLQD